jgi:hypothetical protein
MEEGRNKVKGKEMKVCACGIRWTCERPEMERGSTFLGRCCQTIELAEAIERLIGLTACSRDDAEHALLAARGNLNLAAQLLLEGPPPSAGHVVGPAIADEDCDSATAVR